MELKLIIISKNTSFDDNNITLNRNVQFSTVHEIDLFGLRLMNNRNLIILNIHIIITHYIIILHH